MSQYNKDAPSFPPSASFLPPIPPQTQKRKPWSPAQLSSMVLGIMVVSLGLVSVTKAVALFPVPFFLAAMPSTLNWRRLGKPRWLITSLGIAGLFVILGTLFLLIAKPANDYENRPYLLVGSLTLLAGANIGYLVASWALQWGAYAKWQSTGDFEAIFRHQYNFRLAGLILGAFTGATLLLGIGIVATAQFKRFENDHFSVTYLGWEEKNAEARKACKSQDCALYLGHRTESVAILFVEYADYTSDSIHGIRREGWQTILEQNPDAILKSQHDTKIDDRIAVLFEYEYPDSDAPDTVILDIYVVNGSFLLRVSAIAKNQDALDKTRDAIQELLEHIELKLTDLDNQTAEMTLRKVTDTRRPRLMTSP